MFSRTPKLCDVSFRKYFDLDFQKSFEVLIDRFNAVLTLEKCSFNKDK